mmetsp:Transcript_80493/g.222666  ORF Transcript_80493/g.222666 Transcript_80493/m.222666 type:complete len:209 (+) Transcript_80493:654-1280(+)
MHLGLPKLASDKFHLGHAVQSIGPEQRVVQLLCDLHSLGRSLLRLGEWVSEFARGPVRCLSLRVLVEHRKVSPVTQKHHLNLQRLVLVPLRCLLALRSQFHGLVEALHPDHDGPQRVQALHQHSGLIELLEDLLRCPDPPFSRREVIDHLVDGTVNEQCHALALQVSNLPVKLLGSASRVQGLGPLAEADICRGEDVQQCACLPASIV